MIVTAASTSLAFVSLCSFLSSLTMSHIEAIVIAGPAHQHSDLSEVDHYIRRYFQAAHAQTFLMLSPAMTASDWSNNQLCGMYVSSGGSAGSATHVRCLVALTMETHVDFGADSHVQVRFIHVDAEFHHHHYGAHLLDFAERNTAWPHLRRRSIPPPADDAPKVNGFDHRGRDIRSAH